MSEEDNKQETPKQQAPKPQPPKPDPKLRTIIINTRQPKKL